jgi:K+/H+ antiporter YhaU regulatory subunit KhtT
MKRYVIMAAGDFPSHPEPLAVLNKADVLIAIGIGTAAVVIGVAIAVVVNLGSKKRK